MGIQTFQSTGKSGLEIMQERNNLTQQVKPSSPTDPKQDLVEHTSKAVELLAATQKTGDIRLSPSRDATEKLHANVEARHAAIKRLRGQSEKTKAVSQAVPHKHV